MSMRNIKQIENKLNKINKKTRSKNGISGVDVAIAIGIIVLGIGLITAFIRQINYTSIYTSRQIEVSRIAKNMYEKIRISSYDQTLNLIGTTNHGGYTVKVTNENANVQANTESEIVDKAVSVTGKINVEYKVAGRNAIYSLPFKKYFDRVYGLNPPEDVSKEGYKPVVIKDKGNLEKAYDEETYYRYNFKKDITKYAKDNLGKAYKWVPKTYTVASGKKYLFSKHNLEYKYIPNPVVANSNIKIRTAKLNTVSPSMLTGVAEGMGEWVLVDESEVGDLTPDISGMKVGDLVKFDPTEGVDPELLKITSVAGSAREGQNVSGNGHSTQILDASMAGNKITSWYVLEKEGQNITLVAKEPTETKITLANGRGWLYAEQELHKLCSVYGHHKLANKELNGKYTYEIGNPEVSGELKTKKIADLNLNSGARSLTDRDLEKILGNPSIEQKRTLYRNSDGNPEYVQKYQTRDWPTTRVYMPTLRGVNTDGKCADSMKKSNLKRIYYYVKKELFPQDWASKLFKQDNDQWLAGRSLSDYSGDASFRIRRISTGYFGAWRSARGYSNSFSIYSDSCALRVVCNLTLDSNAKVKSQEGEWIILAR